MPEDPKPLADPPAYVDPVSGERYPISKPRWRSDAGAPLMITALPGIGRDRIDARVRSLWRYAAALPVEVADPITMGEGCTPLVSLKWRGVPARFKLEWLSPTGSFKDRGASVMLSILRGQGVTRVLEDSSGNGGAAIAAYAAAGGMAAKILVPASTPREKTVQMRAYGAEIELIAGTRQETSDAAERQSAAIFYAGHNWQPFFLQGTKTLAYELWEDLRFAAPDNIIIPTGAGSNILGCDIGFGELLRRGEIAGLPRLFAAQPENCAPLHASFDGRTPTILRRSRPAQRSRRATSIAKPRAGSRSPGRAAALRRRDRRGFGSRDREGAVRTRPDRPLRGADLGACRRRVHKTLERGAIHPGETTVLVLTGAGLKATRRIGELMGALPRR